MSKKKKPLNKTTVPIFTIPNPLLNTEAKRIFFKKWVEFITGDDKKT